MKFKKVLLVTIALCAVVLVFAKIQYDKKLSNAVTSSEVANTNSEKEGNVDEPKVDIVFLGDSLTNNGKWSSYFPQDTVHNHGVSGNKTTDIAARLDEALETRPESLFLMVGVNDIWGFASSDDIVNNYRKILDEINEISPETKIHIQNVLPINPSESIKYFPDNPFPDGATDTIEALNKKLALLAEEKELEYIDLNSKFKENEVIKNDLTTDGVHLKPAAYEIWVDEIEEYIN